MIGVFGESGHSKEQIKEHLDRFFDDGVLKAVVRFKKDIGSVIFELDSLKFDGDAILIVDDDAEQDDNGVSFIREGTLNTHPGLLLTDDNGGELAVSQKDLKDLVIEDIWFENDSEPFTGYDVRWDGKELAVGCIRGSIARWTRAVFPNMDALHREDTRAIMKQAGPRLKELAKKFEVKKREAEVALGIRKKPVKKKVRGGDRARSRYNRLAMR